VKDQLFAQSEKIRKPGSIHSFTVSPFTGTEREACYADRRLLPYTEAALLESMRLANVVPTALPHTLEEDVEVEGKVRLSKLIP